MPDSRGWNMHYPISCFLCFEAPVGFFPVGEIFFVKEADFLNR